MRKLLSEKKRDGKKKKKCLRFHREKTQSLIIQKLM